jgi:hypothetical protein
VANLSTGRTSRDFLHRLRSQRARPRQAGRPSRRPHLEALEERCLLVGNWTSVANLAPDAIGTMMLLSDGTVMAQDSSFTAPANRNRWFKLTPDASGSYINGTWSEQAPMRLQRLYYGSNVLPDGTVFVQGGEYSGPAGAQNLTNTGEIYNPFTDTWSNIPNFPQAQFGDDPTMVLPDGRVLGGYINDGRTFIFDPFTTGTWTQTGTKLRNDRSDEETWIKLPDDSILSYDVFTESGGIGHAQRYVPSSGTWVDTGTVPTTLSGGGAFGFEMGPALLLPDGRVWQVGANSHTAFYDPSTDTWTAGPSIPNNAANQLQGADDAPMAMLPNGKILLTVDHPLFNGPTNFYEFDPADNSFTSVTAGAAAAGLNVNQFAFAGRMVVLPSGQVLTTTGGNQLAIYTPDGAPDPSWQPTISEVDDNGDGTFTLIGTQLNGLSSGASYGDDAEMDSNYPIVQLADASGNVFYATTYNWSSTGVATGNTPVSTTFQPPAGIPPGDYSLSVIANGIASDPVPFTVPGGPAPVAESSPVASAHATATQPPLLGGANAVPRPGHLAAHNTDAVAASLTETGTGTGSAPAAAVTTVAANSTGVGAVVMGDRMAVLGYRGPGAGTPDTAGSVARMTDLSAVAARDALFASGDLTLPESLRDA